jgi:hypothetical protein
MFGACVNLTPPWDQKVERDTGPGETGMMAGGTTGAVGSGGVSGDAIPPVDYPAQGGAGGATASPTTVLDGPAAGGAAGALDSPPADTEAGSPGGAGGTTLAATGGAGGALVDAALDAPLGTGGVGRDGALDLGGVGGAGTGGKGSGGGTGGGTGGKGTGGAGTGGRGTGGVGAGGTNKTGGVTGTGGVGTGGSGTGGAGTGGAGTGGAGTGGAGTGGAGTGGVSGTGGAGTGGVSGTGGLGVVSTASLLIYYPCDQTTGPTLSDASGNGRNATLLTGTGGSSGYSFGTGQVNNALHLVKASQGYASIADTGLSAATDMTVATWVYLNSSVAWQRVWDFGIDENHYMFLTPKNGATPTPIIRFGITTNGNGNEQGINGTAELPVGAWHHVAVVLSGGTGTLYVDGQPGTPRTGMTLTPASLGTTTNNYIGRSQFAVDPYLDGSIDDFRVYSRALSAAEILVLASMKAPP